MSPEINKSINSQFSKNSLKFLVSLAILISFIYLIYPFIPAILMGAILALALSPVTKIIEGYVPSRKAALNILMMLIFVIIISPTIIFFVRGAALITTAINDQSFIVKIKLLQDQLFDFINNVSPMIRLNLDTFHVYLNQIINKSTGLILTAFSNFLGEIPSVLLFTLIMWISVYFFLSYEIYIREKLNHYINMNIEKTDNLVSIIKSSCREIFVSNVFTGIIQATIVTAGAAICNISEWFLIFFITFIASFIPVVGAGPVAFLISLYSFATGDSLAGFGMLAVSIISGFSDNLIRPYLASLGEAKVPGIISFIAIIGGISSMGLPGLFIGPLIASLAFGALPLLIEDFFPKNKE